MSRLLPEGTYSRNKGGGPPESTGKLVVRGVSQTPKTGGGCEIMPFPEVSPRALSKGR